MAQRVIVKLPEVKHRTGRSRSSIYGDVKKGTFPAPISIGPRAVGWLESDIEDWIELRIDSSRKKVRSGEGEK